MANILAMYLGVNLKVPYPSFMIPKKKSLPPATILSARVVRAMGKPGSEIRKRATCPAQVWQQLQSDEGIGMMTECGGRGKHACFNLRRKVTN